MRAVPWLLLLLCVSTATAGVQPITSFDPDTTAARRRVARPVSVPTTVWVGLESSPYIGGSRSFEKLHSWDANGMPWVGAIVAWPWTSPHEAWVAFGYERWEYTSGHESFLIGDVRLSVEQFMVRAGIDRLMFRDRAVTAALGAGFGVGYASGDLGQFPGSGSAASAELLARGLAYSPIGSHTRLGAGISAGSTFLLGDNGTPFLHWELTLRLDQSFTAGRHP